MQHKYKLKSKQRLLSNPLFVYHRVRLIVTLWVLICRWAGGGAEKDLHKMDQFPLGKGKRVCSVPPTALCQLCALKTSPLIALPLWMTQLSSVPCAHSPVWSQSYDWLFQIRPHTQSFFLTWFPSYSFIPTRLLAEIYSIIISVFLPQSTISNLYPNNLFISTLGKVRQLKIEASKLKTP